MAEVRVAIEREPGYDLYQCTVPVEQIEQTIAALDRETIDRLPCSCCESVDSVAGVKASIDPLIHDCAVFVTTDRSHQQFCVVTQAVDPTTPEDGSNNNKREGLLVQPAPTGLVALYYRIQGIRSGLLEAAATTELPPETFAKAFRLAVADWGDRAIALSSIDDEIF